MSLIEQLQEECEYDPEGDGSVDNLIAYKDALEDIVGRIDGVLLCNSGTAVAAHYRAQHEYDCLSAADVCGALFGMGLGADPY